MVKVITYGTYDLLHYGHIRLLERAKALGDYLIVGVTADDFDKTRGKINVTQSLMERIEAVKATGLADEIIIEEYEGQKIDDIQKYGVDIFTVGSDWTGKFDYIKEYCDVVYLPRTKGISSSEARSDNNKIKIGLVGETDTELTSISKFIREVKFVNGAEIEGIYTENIAHARESLNNIEYITDDFDELLKKVDAIYIASHPSKHYEQVKMALLKRRHVLCESPIALSAVECSELLSLANEKKCILMDGIKTAYSTAYSRMLLLVKTGKIGDVVSVDTTCTSLKKIENYNREELNKNWNTICEWGPLALLPVFQVLGTDYKNVTIASKRLKSDTTFDVFSKISFIYDNSVASVMVGKSVKSEGELIISGTKGYIYVPAPWWKTDYFEIRYEKQEDNKRYFYQLDGEGIRYEIVAFVRAIVQGKRSTFISEKVTEGICDVIDMFYKGNNTYYI